MTRRRVSENWDGFDSREHPYDEKKEQSFQAGIWIFLAVVFSGIILFITSNVINDLKMKREGTCVLAEYDEDSNRASFRDDKDLFHTLNMVYFDDFKVTEDGKVKLYYMDDPNDATPLSSYGEYFKHYILYGALLALCIWRILAAYGIKPGKRHRYTVQEDENED